MADNLVKVEIVTKPVIPDTLRKLERGQACRFRARDLGTLSSVQSAIYRMNSAGYNFLITKVINNGEQYIVERN